MTSSDTDAGSAPDNIVRFTPRPRPLRADVPPFDPNNPAHLRTWEAMWDFAQFELARQPGEQ
jgi:hypothetical protein